MANSLYPVFVEIDGEVTARSIFVAWCGCTGASTAMSNAFTKAGMNTNNYPKVKTSGNKFSGKFFEQHGWYDALPTLKNKVHAVMINPFTGEGADMMGPDKEELKISMLRIGVTK